MQFATSLQIHAAQQIVVRCSNQRFLRTIFFPYRVFRFSICVVEKWMQQVRTLSRRQSAIFRVPATHGMFAGPTKGLDLPLYASRSSKEERIRSTPSF